MMSIGCVVGIALLAIVAAVSLRLYVKSSGVDTGAVALTPSEAGALVSDDHALMAAIAQLSAAGLVGTAGTHRESAAINIDDFARAVQRKFVDESDRTFAALKHHCRAELDALNARLVEQGLLIGRKGRQVITLSSVSAALAAIAVVVTLMLAPMSIVARVWLSILTSALVVVAFNFVFTYPRRTDRGDTKLERAVSTVRYLNPRFSPSLHTYGVRDAGLAAALFGEPAIRQLDAGLSQETSVPDQVTLRSVRRQRRLAAFLSANLASGYVPVLWTIDSGTSAADGSCGGGCGGCGCG